MSRIAVIKLHESELKFSAGHFMIFDENRRESLHGHDYRVGVEFKTVVVDNGMSFDCRAFKLDILKLCERLDYKFIIAMHSPFMTLTELPDQWQVQVAKQTLFFYKQDAIVLPITNVTLEELSAWFVFRIQQEITQHCEFIHDISVTVSNGRGDAGRSVWSEIANHQQAFTPELADQNCIDMAQI